MTTTYFHDIQTATARNSFKLLFCRWRGGFFQHLVWSVFFFLLYYYSLFFTYHLLGQFDSTFDIKYWFEYFCMLVEHQFHSLRGLLPLNVALGFYVSTIVSRWWSIWERIAWPDALCMKLACHAPGRGEAVRAARRKVARYATLASVVTLRPLAPRVMNRFPNFDRMHEAKILTSEEKSVMLDLEEAMRKEGLKYSLYWLPSQWMQETLHEMNRRGMFTTEMGYVDTVQEAQKYCGLNGGLISYAWVNLPLPYVQLTSLSVYVTLALLPFGSIALSPDPEHVASLGWSASDHGAGPTCYFPFFSLLMFVLVLGWFKVAETLLNPFGNDANDFDMNYIVDRNNQVAHIIVDACASGHTPNHVLGPDALPPPEGEKDDFASDPSMKSALSTLLHTKESKAMAWQEGHQPIDQDLQDLIFANSKSISSREDFGLFRRRRRGDFRNNSERRPPRKREMVHRDCASDANYYNLDLEIVKPLKSVGIAGTDRAETDLFVPTAPDPDSLAVLNEVNEMMGSTSSALSSSSSDSSSVGNPTYPALPASAAEPNIDKKEAEGAEGDDGIAEGRIEDEEKEVENADNDEPRNEENHAAEK